MSIETLNQLPVDFEAPMAYVYYGQGNIKNIYNFHQVYPELARHLEYGTPIPEDYWQSTPEIPAVPYAAMDLSWAPYLPKPRY